MKVENVMTSSVRSCRPETPMSEAAQAMWDADCGVIPVVDDGGRVAGMITDRDICMAALTRGQRLADMRVADAMSTAVRACRADTPIGEAEKIMADAQVRRLPVVDGERHLLGVLSLSDVARSSVEARPGRERGPGTDEVARTLAAVCEPRRTAAQSAGAGTS